MSYTNYTPPVYDPRMFQRQQDEDHLRLLTLFHYILGGLTALGSCFLLIYFAVGLLALSNPAAFSSGSSHSHSAADRTGDQVMGWMFTLIGGLGTAAGWTIGGLTALAGKRLKEHKSATFVTVMSVINCLHMPIGTALGVFTLVVLSRPTVKALFAGQPADVVYASMGQPMAIGTPTDPQQPWYRG